MSVDLDELFDTLRRQADTIPLAGAEPARRRGQHRERVRAAVTVAVAITLVAVGAGVLLRPAGHRTDPPVTRLDWPALPATGSQVPLDGHASGAAVGAGGTRAYESWLREADKSVWLAATDLRTGARAWPPRRLPGAFVPSDVVVLPSAIVVVTRQATSGVPGYHLFAVDPSTGAPLWDRTGDDAGNVVFAGALVVTVQDATGEVRGIDSATGKLRWAQTLTGDARIVQMLGMGTAADHQRIDQSGPPRVFADTRVVLIDRTGTAHVWDARSGATLHSVATGSITTVGMVAYDGLLYTHDSDDPLKGPQHIRAVDLTGDPVSWEVGTVAGRFQSLGACGSGRVCVVSGRTPQTTDVTAFDVVQRRAVWHATSELTGVQMSSSGGNVLLSEPGVGLEFFDQNGQSRLTAEGYGGWLDGTALAVDSPEGGRRLARWSIADRKLTALDVVLPEGRYGCASTSARLVCVTPDAVSTWGLG